MLIYFKIAHQIHVFCFSLSLFAMSLCLQLCVQKLRILIEDTDQNRKLTSFFLSLSYNLVAYYMASISFTQCTQGAPTFSIFLQDMWDYFEI